MGHVFQPLLWMGVCLTGVALAGQLGSTRLGVSFQKLAPDPKRLSPLQKIKTLPAQNMASFLQALVFLPLIALAVYTIARDNLAAFAGLAREGVVPALMVVAASLKDSAVESGDSVPGHRLPGLSCGSTGGTTNRCG